MLVLTRRRGERIVIAGSIVVTVLQVDPGKVRLGIEAPAQISIRRPEVAPRAAVPVARPFRVDAGG
jgi:carbon storage regulator